MLEEIVSTLRGTKRSGGLTIGLRSIPKHDTTEGGVLAACGESDVRERRQVDVSTSGGGGCGSTDVDLDVPVYCDCPRPGIPARHSVLAHWDSASIVNSSYAPLVEVPVIGVVVVDDSAVVVVYDGSQPETVTDAEATLTELNVDGIEGNGVQDSVTGAVEYTIMNPIKMCTLTSRGRRRGTGTVVRR